MSTADTKRVTRAQNERPKKFKPANYLDSPVPPPGIRYRWVRMENRGVADPGNVFGREREGYEVVRVEDVKDSASYDSVREGDRAGVLRTADMILMQCDEELAKDRDRHYAEKVRQQSISAKRELMQKDTRKFPITVDDHQSVERGRPTEAVED